MNGCFWHQHEGCKNATLPATNFDFWQDKLAKTIARDRRNEAILAEQGWQSITLWECEVEKDTDTALHFLLAQLSR